MSRLIFPAVLAITIAGISSAEAVTIHGTVCTDNRNVREAETCLQQALKDADSELKKKYAAVAALLGTNDRKEALARSQRTWGAYVAETCDGLVKPATKESRIGRADVLSCRTELTIERTNDLDRMFYVALHD
ncbi:MAG TPA: lysozyme inhibitor LprI family protein [Rhizomicrobium sp.]|nr:lysozyme inhibitor LprI family protein [Rhizomicrobium sp.]